MTAAALAALADLRNLRDVPTTTRIARVYRLHPSALSVPETAKALGVNVATVHRAHRLLRRRGDYHEEPAHNGSSRLPNVKWIGRNMPGGPSRSQIFSDPSIRTDSGSIDLRAIAERALFASASHTKPLARPQNRQRARLATVHPLPVLMRVPVCIEGEVLDKLRRVHGDEGVGQVLRVLRERGCHDRPTASRRAVHLLLDRDARAPGALFRVLFRQECQLEDEELAAVVHDAEQEWAVDPPEPATDPPTHDALCDAHGRPLWVVQWQAAPEPPPVPRGIRDAELERARRDLENLGEGLD